MTDTPTLSPANAPRPLAGQVALVTGASRGIGAAIAARLAADGATVYGTATTPAGADAITARLGAEGGRGLVLDVTDAAACEAAFAALPVLGILVNNAGITRDGLALRMKDADFEAVLAASLTGAFRLTRLALKGMLKARAGRVVNIGSVVAKLGNPGQANYCAAKAGLEGMTRALAREVGGRGVTVNVVAPGYIATDMTEKLPAEARAAMLASVPLGRPGTPEDVAGVVAFLCGPGGAYVSAQTVGVNGGMAG